MPWNHCPGSPRLAIRVLVPLLTVVAAGPVAAQVVVVDEGSFTISVAGARVGREDYSIRRLTVDGGIVAQGNVLRSDERATVVLTTDSAGQPVRFQAERFSGSRRIENVSGEFRRGLWSGRAVTLTGESAREFRLPDAVVMADDGALHHAWLLVRFASTGPIALLRPHALTVRQIVVEAAVADTVFFGLERYDAQRWVVREGPGGPVVREIWTDLRGRLLRVRVPAEELEAIRDEPPPETAPPALAYGRTEPNSQD